MVGQDFRKQRFFDAGKHKMAVSVVIAGGKNSKIPRRMVIDRHLAGKVAKNIVRPCDAEASCSGMRFEGRNQQGHRGGRIVKR